MARRRARPATGPVLPRHRLRRPRARTVHSVHPGDPRPCPARGRQPHTPPRRPPHELTGRQIFTLTSFKEKALSAASQAGLVNNLNDGLAWGLYPILFATSGLGVARIGVLVALYPGRLGPRQMLTGWLSDHWGRKWLITAGMLTQAAGIAWSPPPTPSRHGRSPPSSLGAGTAMVYPTLLACHR
jgi:hypothetical protein